MYRWMKLSVPASACGLCFAVACSSSHSSQGGVPTTVDSTDASTTGPVGSGGGPATNAACEAIIAYDQRCSDTQEMHTQKCGDDRKTTCTQATKTMSDAYRSAVVACFTSSVACGDTDACVSDKLSTGQPTAAMLKVRDDYCATCGDEAGPDCKNAFFRISNDDGNGDGYMILQVSDDVAADIDAKCTGSALNPADLGATNCRDGFAYCATNEQQNALPTLPDSCQPPPPADDGGA
jgi:hypothetical protein